MRWPRLSPFLTGALFCVALSATVGDGHAATKRAAVYVAIGDGLTLVERNYAALVAKRLPRGSSYGNLAVPYGTLADAISSELAQAVASHPTLVTMWFGGMNDGRIGTSTTVYRSEMDKLLKALAHTHARIFIGTVPNPHFMPYFIAMGPDHLKLKDRDAARFNAAIQDVARRYGAIVVDVFDATRAIWGNPKMAASDGLHLTFSGQAAIAQLFWTAMRRHGL